MPGLAEQLDASRRDMLRSVVDNTETALGLTQRIVQAATDIGSRAVEGAFSQLQRDPYKTAAEMWAATVLAPHGAVCEFFNRLDNRPR